MNQFANVFTLIKHQYNLNMASISESGHVINVAHFREMISVIYGFESRYNPSKASIKTDALSILAENAADAMEKVNSLFPRYCNSVAARADAFSPLGKLVTRIMSSLKACAATDQVYNDAQTISRKIQGRRATPKLSASENNNSMTGEKQAKQISASRMSYDNRMNNLGKLIRFLSEVEEYVPNEADLQVKSLTALYNDLADRDKAVTDSYVLLTNARIARNNIMYDKTTGLVCASVAVKSYIRSVFGTKSPQFRQVSRIRFSKPR